MHRRPDGYYENALWAYSDATSYGPGQTATFFVSSPVRDVSCSVARVGARDVKVHEQAGIRAGHHAVPERAYSEGCAWPETFSLRIGSDWPSGYYRVLLRAGGLCAQHFFVVRPANPGAAARHVLVLATNTYQAYNGWGGRSFYGSDAAFADSPNELTDREATTPVAAFDRPFSRCLVAAPVPTRIPSLTRRGVGEAPGLPPETGALVAGGASIWDLPAGFLNKWEHQFVAWAEHAGVALDYLAQSDLDADPGRLGAWPSYLSVGHDEYWTSEERDAVEAFVEAGGSASFFSGNTCFWQVRLERAGRSLVGYKAAAPKHDPVRGTERADQLTSFWSDPQVGRPENSLTGVSFARAGYARVGYALSRGTGGYTIYRPDHWCLAGTDLGYGDLLGDAFALCAYEIDGCALRLEDGLPVPTGEDGAPSGFEIVGMTPATLGEPRETPTPGLLGRNDLAYVARRLFDGDEERAARGHATFGSFRRGRGEVFTAATTEWAWGLTAGDAFIDRITRNVLERAQSRAG